MSFHLVYVKLIVQFPEGKLKATQFAGVGRYFTVNYFAKTPNICFWQKLGGRLAGIKYYI